MSLSYTPVHVIISSRRASYKSVLVADLKIQWSGFNPSRLWWRCKTFNKFSIQSTMRWSTHVFIVSKKWVTAFVTQANGFLLVVLHTVIKSTVPFVEYTQHGLRHQFQQGRHQLSVQQNTNLVCLLYSWHHQPEGCLGVVSCYRWELYDLAHQWPPLNQQPSPHCQSCPSYPLSLEV